MNRDDQLWWVVVHDWQGQLVYDGSAPCPPELVTLTAEDCLAGHLFTFDMTPMGESVR